MTTRLYPGPLYLRGSMDSEGYRNYDAGFLVESSTLDGPANVMQTPGLPIPGSTWLFGDDLDIWAWCTWDIGVKEAPPQAEGEPWTHWVVNKKFTTRPPGLGISSPGSALNHADPKENKRSGCRDFRFEDPLTEPAKIGGAFVSHLSEKHKDRFGKSLLFPTFERITGDGATFDDSRFSVRVEKNVLNLELDLVAAFRDHVNDRPLWGFPARCVKFKNFSWERHYYGSCYHYYTRVMDFEVSIDLRPDGTFEGWDKEPANHVTKCLLGKHAPSGCGSGCKIQPTATGLVNGRVGSLVAATVSAGGSGYPPKSYVPLALVANLPGTNDPDPARGQQAVVVGYSNENGVIANIAPVDPTGNSQEVLYGGTGYTVSDAPYDTGSNVSWKLNPILAIAVVAGVPIPTGLVIPNPLNPSHFMQYADRQGKPASCLVNKAGVPVVEDEPEVNSSTRVEAYKQANLLLLGIPADLNA